MLSRSVTGVLSLALAAGLFVAGCSSLPSSPSSSGGGTATTLGLDSSGPGSGSTGTTSSVSSSVYIRACRGGTVAAGNFTVVIPPQALAGDAIVTVRQPDVTKPDVQLSITPESRNHFRIPVTLVADITPMASTLVATSYLSWWDPATGQWDPLAQSSVNVGNLTVQAPVWHFSTYQVQCDGKAGW